MTRQTRPNGSTGSPSTGTRPPPSIYNRISLTLPPLPKHRHMSSDDTAAAKSWINSTSAAITSLTVKHAAYADVALPAAAAIAMLRDGVNVFINETGVFVCGWVGVGVRVRARTCACVRSFELSLARVFIQATY